MTGAAAAPAESLPARPGWRFWVWWVLATNAGWFGGLALGTAAARVLESGGVVRLPGMAGYAGRAAVTALVASACFGLLQWLVLRRWLPVGARWVAATVVGWTLGIFGAALLTGAVTPALLGLRLYAVMAFVAGAVVGVPQWLVLRRHLARSIWWIPISAVGWGVLFPGALPGIGLIWLAHRRDRSAARERT